jgi:hypothetical protein
MAIANLGGAACLVMETFADAFPIPPSTPWQDWTTISPADLSVVTKYNAEPQLRRKRSVFLNDTGPVGEPNT